MAELEAQWVWFGKSPGSTSDYEVLEGSSEPNTYKALSNVVWRTFPGTPDRIDNGPERLPWCTVSPARGQDRSPMWVVKIVEARGEKDGFNRAIVSARVFFVPYPEAAAAGLSAARLLDALDEAPLVPGAPVSVRLPDPAATRADILAEIRGLGTEWAATVAAWMLAGPVSIGGADNADRHTRLAIVDAVTALLPYGVRAHLTAHTWTGTDTRAQPWVSFAEIPGARRLAVNRRLPLPPEGPAADYHGVVTTFLERNGLDDLVERLAAMRTPVDLAKTRGLSGSLVTAVRDLDWVTRLIEASRTNTLNADELARRLADAEPGRLKPDETRALLAAAFAAAVRGHTGCAAAAEVFTRKAKAADAAVAAIVAELGAAEDAGTPDRDARIWALADRLGLGNTAAAVLLTGMGADGAPPERMVRMLRRIGAARARHLEAVRDFLWQEKVVAGALLAYESEDRRQWLAVLDPDNASVPVWLRPYRILGARHATGSLPTPGDAIAVADLTENGEEFTRVVTAFWPTFTETAGNEQYRARLFAALTRRHIADPDTAVRIDLLLVIGGYLPHGAEQRRLSIERYLDAVRDRYVHDRVAFPRWAAAWTGLVLNPGAGAVSRESRLLLRTFALECGDSTAAAIAGAVGGALENPGLYDTRILDDTWWHALIQYDPSLEQSRTLTRVRQGGLSLREVVDLWADSLCAAPSRAGVAVVGGTDRKPMLAAVGDWLRKSQVPAVAVFDALYGGLVARRVDGAQAREAVDGLRLAVTRGAWGASEAERRRQQFGEALAAEAKHARQHRRAIRKSTFQPPPAQPAPQGGAAAPAAPPGRKGRRGGRKNEAPPPGPPAPPEPAGNLPAPAAMADTRALPAGSGMGNPAPGTAPGDENRIHGGRGRLRGGGRPSPPHVQQGATVRWKMERETLVTRILVALVVILIGIIAVAVLLLSDNGSDNGSPPTPDRRDPAATAPAAAPQGPAHDAAFPAPKTPHNRS